MARNRVPPYSRTKTNGCAIVTRYLSILTLLSLLFGLVLQAQAPGGRIQGEVFNVAPNGERSVIPGAEVVLIPAPGAHPLGQAPPAPMKTASDATGHFAFDGVPGGCYQATATSAGLTAQGRETCLLAQSAQITLDIEMKLAVVTSSVEVSSKMEAVETAESSATGAVEASTLQTAPSLSQQFDTYQNLLPGVVRGSNYVINLKGARSAQSSLLVNNTNATDPYTGASAINLPIESISSVKLLSNPYDSEYGNFAGAVSTVDTKASDFNKFHYNLHQFVPGLKRREGRWAGIEKFLPRLTVTDPLIRNRIAITQSFEYRYNRPEVKKANLPGLHNDTKLESFSSLTRVDFQISNRHTAAASLSFFPQKLIYVGLDTFTPQPATPDLRQRGYMFAAEDQYAFQSGALIESRASYKTFDLDVRPNSTGLYLRGIETTQGGFFHRQHRESGRFEESETYHFAPLRAGGQHSIKAGWRFSQETYDGRQTFDTVAILGVSNRLVQRIDFTPPALLNVDQNQYTFFLQDKWTVWPRLTVDVGLRFDRDSIADEGHAAPRVGFAYVLTGDNKTVLRGGFGLFYDRVNLNIASFLDLPARTETRFSPTGAVTSSRFYHHRIERGIRDPRSASWSAQLDREVTAKLFLRAGFQQRITTRNFILNPELTPSGDFLALSNNGRDRYREFEATARYRFGKENQLMASYVRSSAIGNLNDFNTFFGNTPQPIIRGDELTRLSFDAPNRFLSWATLHGPFKATISPLVEIHTGFPYSIVNEDRDFVGRRNQAGRFRKFASIDLEVLRPFHLPIINKTTNLGVGIFNLLNHFNPIDLQNNLASPRFGVFTYSHDRVAAARLQVGF